jgi:hypothetical protein
VRRSLKDVKISDSYPRLVQQIDGIFYDGAGNLISGISGAQGPTGAPGPQGINGFLTDWEFNNEIVVSSVEQVVFSGDYVLEDSSMIIQSTMTQIQYGPTQHFKKIGKVFIGGNLLLKDSTLQNDGLLSVAGGIILIGNSQVTGDGTIV